MSNFWRKKEIVFEVGAGAHIRNTIVEAIALSAEEDGCLITFDFNEVRVSVRKDSSPDLIFRDWHRALHHYIDPNVGPYPNLVLTDEEKENDNQVEAKNERRRQELQAEYEAQAKAKRNALEAKLKGAPPMEESNPDAWEEAMLANRDPYGGAVITYAQRWARLMQVEISNGKTLEEVASATSHEADLEGITGFMFGAAVTMLARCWKHGEQLRRWHNLDTQIGNEGELANENGGVLNPALLSIQLNDE